VCDRLPGHGNKQDVPFACLQASTSMVEKEIGRYCGGSYLCGTTRDKSICTTPEPCPDGLYCALNPQKGLADASMTCLIWNY
jgi:hypothetical protein